MPDSQRDDDLALSLPAQGLVPRVEGPAAGSKRASTNSARSRRSSLATPRRLSGMRRAKLRQADRSSYRRTVEFAVAREPASAFGVAPGQAAPAAISIAAISSMAKPIRCEMSGPFRAALSLACWSAIKPIGRRRNLTDEVLRVSRDCAPATRMTEFAPPTACILAGLQGMGQRTRSMASGNESRRRRAPAKDAPESSRGNETDNDENHRCHKHAETDNARRVARIAARRLGPAAWPGLTWTRTMHCLLEIQLENARRHLLAPILVAVATALP